MSTINTFQKLPEAVAYSIPAPSGDLNGRSVSVNSTPLPVTPSAPPLPREGFPENTSHTRTVTVIDPMYLTTQRNAMSAVGLVALASLAIGVTLLVTNPITPAILIGGAGLTITTVAGTAFFMSLLHASTASRERQWNDKTMSNIENNQQDTRVALYSGYSSPKYFVYNPNEGRTLIERIALESDFERRYSRS